MLWGSNISQTRIPDAHFAWEARYNGAKIVGISPDFNSSMVHTDLFLSHSARHRCRAGAGRGQVHRRQQSLRHALRQGADRSSAAGGQAHQPVPARVRPGAAATGFFFHDAKNGKRHEAPGSMGSKEKTIALNGADPALPGPSVQLAMADAEVTTVFELMKQKLAPYTLESVPREPGFPSARSSSSRTNWPHASRP